MFGRRKSPPIHEVRGPLTQRGDTIAAPPRRRSSLFQVPVADGDSLFLNDDGEVDFDYTDDSTASITLLSGVSSFGISGSNLAIVFTTIIVTLHRNADNRLINITAAAGSNITKTVALTNCP